MVRIEPATRGINIRKRKKGPRDATEKAIGQEFGALNGGKGWETPGRRRKRVVEMASEGEEGGDGGGSSEVALLNGWHIFKLIPSHDHNLSHSSALAYTQSHMSPRTTPTPTRRLIPIKRLQGEPLTRTDLQYDLLHNIFSDSHPVFTDPWPNTPHFSTPKLTFRNLYIKTLLHSTKTTKAFRDKLIDSDTFAQDFAMIALLVNVGRINTTMSCASLLQIIYDFYTQCPPQSFQK